MIPVEAQTFLCTDNGYKVTALKVKPGRIRIKVDYEINIPHTSSSSLSKSVSLFSPTSFPPSSTGR